MSLLAFQMQARWQHHGHPMRSRGVDRVDPSPRDLHLDTCVKRVLSDTNDGWHVAFWGGVDLHRMALIKSRSTTLKAIHGLISTWRWRSNGRNPILARSWIMRTWILEIVDHGDGENGGMMVYREIVVHDRRAIVAKNRPSLDQTILIFRGNSSLKTDELSPYFWTLDWFVK